MRLWLLILVVGWFWQTGNAQAQLTYSHDVAPILQQRCQGCHRPDDIAPFALFTYDDVVAHALAIRAAVGSGIMPPWKPIPGHGEFKNKLSLADSERQTILDWIDAGMALGDPAELQPPISGGD